MARRHRLVDCHPQWITDTKGVTPYLHFDCPEGHAGCSHTIPFTPALDGSPRTSASAQWERSGDTFETVSLAPSIRRRPQYASREEALADGCIPEYVTEDFLCAMHVNLVDGSFVFADDSH